METGTQRLHPLTILYRALAAAPQYLPIIFLLLYHRSQQLSWILLIEVLVTPVLSIPLFLLWYLSFEYCFTDTGILIRWGVLRRQERLVSYDRIQNVHIQRSVLHRLFGLAKIEIETAGAHTTEVSLDAISYAEAKRLQQFLLRRQQQTPPVQPPSAASAATVYSISNRHIALLGLARFFPALFILLALPLQSLFDFFPGTTSWTLSSFLAQLLSVLSHFFPFGILGVLLGILFLNQLLHATITLLRYGNFSLAVYPQQFVVRSGILVHQTRTIPRQKIQHIEITTNPLLRFLGFATLQCVTASAPQAGYIHSFLLPLAPFSQIHRFLREHFQITLPDHFHSVHPLYWIRTSSYTAAVFLPVALLLFSFDHLFSSLSLLLLIMLTLRHYFHYRHFGYAITDRRLTLHTGVLRERWKIIPLEKLQAFGITAGLLQRRWKLASLWVETAAGTGALTTIPDLSLHSQKLCLALIRPVSEQERNHNRATDEC